MTTKAEVTEYINEQFKHGEDSANTHYWFTHDDGVRAAFWQEWMSPEVARILEKLLGNCTMISQISKNGSNK